MTAIVASIAGAVSGVHSGIPAFSWAAVLIFTGALVATSIEVNRPFWVPRGQAPVGDATTIVALRNSTLLGIAYMWGGLTMFAVYRLAGLRWQHGWQYALGMGALAALVMLYVWFLERPDSRLRSPAALAIAAQFTVIQAVGSLIGLGFLVGSGKIASAKGDWAANQIFVAGGLAIAVLSALAVYTTYRVSRDKIRSEPVDDRAAQPVNGR